MNRQRDRTIALDIMIVFISLLFCFIAIETGYRVLDPFPYFSSFVINNTEHGNLSTYNEILGWKGVPLGEAEFVTKNNRVWLANNRYGFRDIEHKESSGKKPVIVFLGDSFTWGYEVEFEEMFVNLVRVRLPTYEIFNLAHRGYGTDQAFLTFKGWHDKQPLKLVILMFSENDITDNNSMVRYMKPKPKYRLVDNELALAGVPVPKGRRWARPPLTTEKPVSKITIVKEYLFHSHFLHDINFRWKNHNRNRNRNRNRNNKQDLTLTSRILDELNKEVKRRDANFVVVIIPSKREIEKLKDFPPYQIDIAKLCQQLGIEYLDIAPNFKDKWYRTYYRQGRHWNKRGHEIAAEALYDYFVTRNVAN